MESRGETCESEQRCPGGSDLGQGEAEGDGKEKDNLSGPEIIFWKVRAGEDHLQTLMTGGDRSGVGCVALTGAVISLPPN